MVLQFINFNLGFLPNNTFMKLSFFISSKHKNIVLLRLDLYFWKFPYHIYLGYINVWSFSLLTEYFAMSDKKIILPQSHIFFSSKACNLFFPVLGIRPRALNKQILCPCAVTPVSDVNVITAGLYFSKHVFLSIWTQSYICFSFCHRSLRLFVSET